MGYFMIMCQFWLIKFPQKSKIPKYLKTAKYSGNFFFWELSSQRKKHVCKPYIHIITTMTFVLGLKEIVLTITVIFH